MTKVFSISSYTILEEQDRIPFRRNNLTAQTNSNSRSTTMFIFITFIRVRIRTRRSIHSKSLAKWFSTDNAGHNWACCLLLYRRKDKISIIPFAKTHKLSLTDISVQKRKSRKRRKQGALARDKARSGNNCTSLTASKGQQVALIVPCPPSQNCVDYEQ